LRNRILLPILETGYGDVLHRGDLRLAFERGALELHYFDWQRPIEPSSSSRWLRGVARRLVKHELGGDVLRQLRECLTRLEELPGTVEATPRSIRARAVGGGAAR